jgi:predicted nucleic-acid-binding Zn-ribbon protein
MTTSSYTFTKKDFEEFLREKGFDKKCPACNNAHYGIVPDSVPETYFFYPVGDSNSKSLGLGYPVITLICDNCGYMWHFAAEVVHTWYNKKRNIHATH